LHTLLTSLQDVHLIGHSMGGLVIRNYLHKYHDIANIKSVVTIATPHNQSICAHTMSKSLFRKVLGTAGDSGLTKPLKEWESNIPIGCIAGLSKSKMSANFFIMFNPKEDDSDGTVYVEEALLNNATDKIILKGSHTGLLFKKEVATQCLYFLEHEKFQFVEKA
jgi:PGAP1-like protein